MPRIRFSRRGFLTYMGIGASSLAVGAPHRLVAKQISSDETDPAILLPSIIYACVGSEMNIYWDGIIRSGLDLEQFRYNVTTTTSGDDGSKQENYRWAITPTEAIVGEQTLTLDVYYRNALVASKTTTLRIRQPQLSSPVSRKLLVIGDSTTSHGEFLAELVNLCSASNFAIETVGTKTTTFNDANNVSRSAAHEGLPGARINIIAADASSPFLFGGTFNFAAYLAANAITLAADDWVIINLGINDVFGFLEDSDLIANFAIMTMQLEAMIASIKSAVGGIRIGLCLPIPPSHDQDAFAENYGSGQTQWRCKRNHDLWVEAMLTRWDGKQQNGLYLIPLSSNFDTRNNVLTASVPANSRNTALVTRQNNAVHPALSGYWQIADTLFAFLRGNEV